MFALCLFFCLVFFVQADSLLRVDFSHAVLPACATLKVSQGMAEKVEDKPLFIEGLSGMALNCGGYSQYGRFVSVSAPFDADGPFTVTCWFKPRGGYLTALLYYRPSWDALQGFSILHNGSQLALRVGKEYIIKTDRHNPIQNNKWYFLALSWDGLSWRLFLNGMWSVAEDCPSYVQPPPNCPFNIGGYNIITNNIFQGSIEEVEFFNAALGEEELFKLIKKKIPR